MNISHKKSRKKLREFGIVIGFILPLIIGGLIPFLRGHLFASWTIYPGILLITLGIIKPEFLFYPYIVWMKFGYLLGWINSRIILGIIYIIVLIPIALFMKIFGYDPLRKKKSKNKTYRELKTNYKIDLERIF
tara:strand:+ start:22222 stop:22620 length:399 start_codon:yes stop_codon:yes gene_type:complete